MKHSALRAGTIVLAIVLIGFIGCKSDGPKTSPGALPNATADGTDQKLNASTYYAHAHLLERQGNFSQAAEQYAKALELSPNFVSARNRFGITLNKLGRHAEATAQFSLAIKQEPTQAHLYNNLGFSQFLQERYQDACESYQQALQLKPEYHRARMNYGVVLAKLGHYAEALTQFTLATSESDAYFNLAVICTEQGEYARAAQSLEKALALNPNFDAARDQLRLVAKLAASDAPAVASRNGQQQTGKSPTQSQHKFTSASGHEASMPPLPPSIKGDVPQASRVHPQFAQNSKWQTEGMQRVAQMGATPTFGPGHVYLTPQQIQVRNLIQGMVNASKHNNKHQYQQVFAKLQKTLGVWTTPGMERAQQNGYQPTFTRNSPSFTPQQRKFSRILNELANASMHNQQTQVEQLKGQLQKEWGTWQTAQKTKSQRTKLTNEQIKIKNMIQRLVRAARTENQEQYDVTKNELDQILTSMKLGR